MRRFSTWFIVTFLIGLTNQCPTDVGKKSQLEGMLVNSDFKGSVKYISVWTRTFLKDACECSYNTFTKKDDVTIDVAASYRKTGGKLEDYSSETAKKAHLNGLYSLSGISMTTNLPFTGYIYILYSDKYSITYYTCINNSENYNIGVQVRSNEWKKLATKEKDNEVKRSIKRGYGKLVQAANILELTVGREFAKHNVDINC